MSVRGLLIVVLTLLSVVLVTGRACAASDAFDADIEVTGGAHRMVREGIDHPVLKIGAWSAGGAAHEIKN